MDRREIQGYLRGMKVLLLATFVVFFSAANPARARLIDQTAALVNSNVVADSDIQKFKRQLGIRKELDPFIAFFNYVPKTDKEILAFLIQEALVMEQFKPSPEDIDQEIDNIMRENSLTLDVLKSVLGSQNVSYDEYRVIVGFSIAKRRMIDRELRPLAIVSDDEVKNFYYTQQEFRKERNNSKLLISYDVSQLQAPSKEIATKAYEELSRGVDLESVVSKFSADGVESVELGVLREDKLNKKIRDSLDGLKVGESSKPVSLGGSVYVIHKVNSISAPHDPVYEGMKDRIKSVLFQRALKQQLELWTDRQREEAYVNVAI